MIQSLIEKKNSWISLVILLTVYPVNTASSFDGFYNYKGIKCQTSCHQPELISQAKINKTTISPCKNCHTGEEAFYSSFKIHSKRTHLTTNRIVKRKTKQQLKINKNSVETVTQNRITQPTSAMSFVPSGEFIMGSNDRWDDEMPEHIASTSAFFIDLYEVTNQDYKKFVDVTKHNPPFHWPEGTIPKGKENHPVIYVNWFDATSYCKWNGKRLPTEQEWEKAARGEEGNIYPWGNFWDINKSNNPYKYSTGTEPVGSYPQGRSPYGLYDMSGNVWEWVDSYYLPHPGNMSWRPEYGEKNRILKGGSWFDCLSYGCGLSAPSFNRSFFTPEVRNNSFGFRCAKKAIDNAN